MVRHRRVLESCGLESTCEEVFILTLGTNQRVRTALPFAFCESATPSKSRQHNYDTYNLFKCEDMSALRQLVYKIHTAEDIGP
jgi:hypothetical protein